MHVIKLNHFISDSLYRILDEEIWLYHNVGMPGEETWKIVYSSLLIDRSVYAHIADPETATVFKLKFG